IVSQKLTLGETKETTQALPFLGLMKTGGWGELTKEIHRGQFSEGVFKPNIESSRRNEQRNQQIARIITAMLECEVFFVAYIEKYRAKYT
ncbi:18468_t:CDS:1, partial [Racocetra persica]